MKNKNSKSTVRTILLQQTLAILNGILSGVITTTIVLPYLSKNYSSIWWSWIFLISIVALFILITIFIIKKTLINLHDIIFIYSLFLYLSIIFVISIFNILKSVWILTSVSLLFFLTLFFIFYRFLPNSRIYNYLYKMLCITSILISSGILVSFLFETNYFELRFLSFGNDMILIKGGQFLFDREITKVNDFYVGKYEVTTSEYLKFIEANYNDSTLYPQWKLSEVKDNYYEGFIEKNQPIVGITYNQAKKYCDWLSQRKGEVYALPTEIQWVYAARAGGTGVFGLGEKDKEITEYNLVEYAWFSNEITKTSVIGQKLPNAFGLYDIFGNGEEWCRSELSDRSNITKGGSFEDPTIFCRTNSKQNYPPGELSRTITFRVVKNIKY